MLALRGVDLRAEGFKSSTGKMKERRGRGIRGERKDYGKGRREAECGEEEIKHRVRYPSVPGLESDQLRGSGVKGQRPLGLRVRWSERLQIHTGDGIKR